MDWYEAYADIGGERQKTYMFCMRSMASGGAFHCAFPHASQQAFLEAHERAFAYFGGVFEKLRYDNLKSAVKKILRGHQREETTRFIAFRSHWEFESEFCTPAEGHEKGGVEGEGGYFRRNHMVPVPNVASWEELDALLLESSKDDEQRIIGERTQTVGAGMSLEQEHLKGLKEGFDLAAVHFPQVNTSGCVKVLTNFYSVPLPVGLEVQAKVHSAYVEIWHQGECVAQHERCFNRQQKVLNLEHYLDALTKKPGAFAGSTALEQWRAQGRWPASFDHFWEALKQRRGKQAGTRAMIEVLLLGRQYGYPRLKEALEKALDLSCFDVDAVRLLLTTDQAGKREAGEAVEIGALIAYDRPQPTTRDYDQLLANWPVEWGDSMNAPVQQATIRQYAKQLQLRTIGGQFAEVAEQAVRQKQSHLSYLEALLGAEVEERDRNAVARRIKEAHFPKVKTLEEFAFSDVPQIPAALVRNLAEGGYLSRSEPVIFLGEAGTGKTHLATGLAVEACRQRKPVRFTTAAQLVNELTEAKNKSELNRVTNRWTRYELIVIDEMAYVAMPEAAAELLFQIIAGRAERAAVIVTTNLPFSEWTTMFPNARLCKAMLDRLTDQAHIIETGTESYRFRRTLEKKKGGKR